MQLIKIENKTQIIELSILADEIWHEYWTCILSNEQIDYMVEKFQSYNAINHQIEYENYSYYFLTTKKEVIGYCGISEKKDYLFLSKLYLKENYRHLGYGHKAYEQIVEIAQKLGYKSIQLTVNKNNTNTINAYFKYGFKTIDAVVTDIGNGFVMDDYIMEYKIGS